LIAPTNQSNREAGQVVNQSNRKNAAKESNYCTNGHKSNVEKPNHTIIKDWKVSANQSNREAGQVANQSNRKCAACELIPNPNGYKSNVTYQNLTINKSKQSLCK